MKQLVFTISGIMVALSTLFLFGCKKENYRPDDEDPFPLETNLMMGNRLFDNSLKSRDADHVFELLDVIRKQELLEVTVKGGDSAGSFQFLWDGRVQESFPMGIRLILLYSGATANFDPNKEVTVSVDLHKIIGERNNVSDYHFYVINGSKIQTVTLNPDGTATKERK